MEMLNFNKYKILSCNYDSAVSLIVKALYDKSKHVFIHLNNYNYTVLENKSTKLQDNFPYTLFFEGIAFKAAVYCATGKNLADINGTDLFPLLAKELSDKQLSVYFLGSDALYIEDAVNNIKKDYPKLIITGFHHGFFDINESEKLIDEINNSKADLLIIGMGMDKEFDFLVQHFPKIQTKAVWNVGGLFDFLSGKYIRAPLIMRKMRLEWLFRFMISPVYRFKRIFLAPIRLAIDTIKYRKSIKIEKI